MENFTIDQINEKEWATIGGRIEDYVLIANTQGIEKAYKEIEKTYDDLAKEVYRGLIVYMSLGYKAYYKI